MARRVLVLLLALSAPASAGVQSARDAATLQVRLTQVAAELEEKRDILALESMFLDPFSTRAAETSAAARKIGDEYRRSVLPLMIESTTIADRLQVYRETGELPSPRHFDPSVFVIDLDESTLDIAPHPIPGLPLPPMGLVALQRQLAPFHAVLFPDALAAARRKILPAAAQAPRPRAAVLPAARFERDQGIGRTQLDPVPGLIEQLSSLEARERALAADELGKRGEAAAPALPALRRALADEDRRVRASAVLALGGIGRVSAEAQADIRRALLDPDEEVRFSARAALLRLGRTR